MEVWKIIVAGVLLLVAFNLFAYSYMKRRIAAAKARASAAPPVTVEGGCHCGAVRFSIQTKPMVELLECNCSICSASGYQHLFIPHRDFTLMTDATQITSYRFGSQEAEHLFCRTCGIKSYYQPKSHPDCWSVNYRCLDDGVDLNPVYRQFDGRNWEEANAALHG